MKPRSEYAKYVNENDMELTEFKKVSLELALDFRDLLSQLVVAVKEVAQQIGMVPPL